MSKDIEGELEWLTAILNEITFDITRIAQNYPTAELYDPRDVKYAEHAQSLLVQLDSLRRSYVMLLDLSPSRLKRYGSQSLTLILDAFEELDKSVLLLYEYLKSHRKDARAYIDVIERARLRMNDLRSQFREADRKGFRTALEVISKQELDDFDTPPREWPRPQQPASIQIKEEGEQFALQTKSTSLRIVGTATSDALRLHCVKVLKKIIENLEGSNASRSVAEICKSALLEFDAEEAHRNVISCGSEARVIVDYRTTHPEEFSDINLALIDDFGKASSRYVVLFKEWREYENIAVAATVDSELLAGATELGRLLDEEPRFVTRELAGKFRALVQNAELAQQLGSAMLSTDLFNSIDNVIAAAVNVVIERGGPFLELVGSNIENYAATTLSGFCIYLIAFHGSRFAKYFPWLDSYLKSQRQK